ncbi:Gfo/Idh/MocA family protein [Demequina sp. NBRC 110055]|uniref:Gfo/Idh/MocA family protein n=1 Tax=Demequina sp. NBRC 110055 TaxID=1570344 RepID=UPI000A018F43|nr:Gfo/Idh/MocA family oxidoreductase [Demequina sp. NBRC 110055]
MTITTPPVSFAVVGYGWRAPFFLRPAAVLPDQFRVTGVVTRRAEVGERAMAERGLASWRSLADAVAADRPDFVVVSVPWEAAPEVTREAVALGLPVLCETPPAPDLDGLHRLWADVGASGLVQIAEQYPGYPGHVARRAVIDRGLIGRVNEVEVSSTHLYHAMGVLRRMLGVGDEGAQVTAIESSHPLVDPHTREGWTDDNTERDATTLRAIFRFESGRVGTYDFTDNQWWNALRADRIAVRGSRGEIANDRVTALTGPRTITTTHLERRHTGVELNLEGNDLDHISLGTDVLYRNPWVGTRMADDEIAVTDLLAGMSRWIHADGAPPYPLADGAQDWALAIAMQQAASSGQRVTLERQPWARG